jgi:hypothetical protein
MGKDTGGYAFPHTIEHLHKPVTAGMTMRDYFAAKAMQGFIPDGGTNVQEIAQAAYIVADAMLKEREKK